MYRALPILFVFPLLMGTPTSRAADDLPPIATAVKEKLTDPAKPFTMFVKLTVKPGQEKAFEEAFAVARVNTRKEKGNLAYDLSKLVGEKPVYVVYEKWKDLDALIVHAKADYISKLLAALPDLIEGSPELEVGIPAAE